MSEKNDDDDLVLLLQIGVEWLNQYARFLRRAPDLPTRLGRDGEDFELMPVPKLLLDRLAVPGIIGSGALGSEVESEIERMLTIGADQDPPASEEVVAVAEAFVEAIVAGSAKHARALLSADFLDGDGRGNADLSATLEELISSTKHRELRVQDLRSTLQGERSATVRLDLAWRAELAETAELAALKEEFAVEILVGRNEAGEWKICGLRTP